MPAQNLVPRDFSARVARRAFAGDPGERFEEPRTVLVGAVVGSMESISKPDERHLRFVMALTAAAAVVLLVLSVAIQSRTLPSGSSLLAEPKANVEDARKQLDQLNHKPAALDATVQPVVRTKQ
jgi:hypothetical protein